MVVVAVDSGVWLADMNVVGADESVHMFDEGGWISRLLAMLPSTSN